MVKKIIASAIFTLLFSWPISCADLSIWDTKIPSNDEARMRLDAVLSNLRNCAYETTPDDTALTNVSRKKLKKELSILALSSGEIHFEAENLAKLFLTKGEGISVAIPSFYRYITQNNTLYDTNLKKLTADGEDFVKTFAMVTSPTMLRELAAEPNPALSDNDVVEITDQFDELNRRLNRTVTADDIKMDDILLAKSEKKIPYNSK